MAPFPCSAMAESVGSPDPAPRDGLLREDLEGRDLVDVGHVDDGVLDSRLGELPAV